MARYMRSKLSRGAQESACSRTLRTSTGITGVE
jgi:hypothetical protein